MGYLDKMPAFWLEKGIKRPTGAGFGNRAGASLTGGEDKVSGEWTFWGADIVRKKNNVRCFRRVIPAPRKPRFVRSRLPPFLLL